jgi:lipid-binding SYLF domain-containing protein
MRGVRTLVALLLVLTTWMIPAPAGAASAMEIDREVAEALNDLFETSPEARALAGRAKAILVFPSIVKAGFIIGAPFGDGALVRGTRSLAYYNIAAASYGLQAGAQRFGYAMFFMTSSALDYLDKSQGFEVGVGPSIVVVDEGVARTLTTTTTQSDVYAFTFGQRGLMAGLGLQGSKITRIYP